VRRRVWADFAQTIGDIPDAPFRRIGDAARMTRRLLLRIMDEATGDMIRTALAGVVGTEPLR
jgi:hypothetical protein